MMMKKTILGFLLATLVFAGLASAQMKSLTYGEDYTTSDEVHLVTTVRVTPNRIDHYLAGIRQTWVPAMKIGQEMGLNAGHSIHVSELPLSGGFNVLLIAKFENMAQREKNNDPETAAEFNRRVEAKISEDENFEITEGYVKIRDITGEYLMRSVTLK
jgi:hypothetical protein